VRAPLRNLKLIATREHNARRLDEVLTDWLTRVLERPVSRAKARKLFMAGAVFLDGQRVRVPSMQIVVGALIETHIDVAKLFSDATSHDMPFELKEKQILFEDEDLIAVDKPFGLPAHATLDESRDNLFAAVTRFLAQRDGSSEPYLGSHQRLDRGTSGVVLFTKSKRVNGAIGKIFQQHLAAKTYQALTHTNTRLRKKQGESWTTKNRLGKVAQKSKRAQYGSVRSDGDSAETSFQVLGSYASGLWIEAMPKTGRTHQIRVHLSEHGLSIIGDDLYGFGKASRIKLEVPRLMLHAVRLAFVHPVTGRELSIVSPLPSDFERCRRALAGGGD